jgi:hypothetical protein
VDQWILDAAAPHYGEWLRLYLTAYILEPNDTNPARPGEVQFKTMEHLFVNPGRYALVQEVKARARTLYEVLVPLDPAIPLAPKMKWEAADPTVVRVDKSAEKPKGVPLYPVHQLKGNDWRDLDEEEDKGDNTDLRRRDRFLEHYPPRKDQKKTQ